MLVEKVRKAKPDVRIDGVCIQKMVKNIDYELILGSKKDNDFGSVILFGLGGIGVELFKDFSIGLPPLNQVLARRVIEETNLQGPVGGSQKQASHRYEGFGGSDGTLLEHDRRLSGDC